MKQGALAVVAMLAIFALICIFTGDATPTMGERRFLSASAPRECTFASLKSLASSNLQTLASGSHRCSSIAIGNDLKVENIGLNANVDSRKLTVTGRIHLRTMPRSPRFDVTAMYTQGGAWSFNSKLSSQIQIGGNFRITDGELSVNSEGAASLNLQLQLTLSGRTMTGTVSLSQEGNDFTISGSLPGSTIPNFCIGNQCLSWSSILVTIKRESNRWSGGMTLTKQFGRTIISSTLSVSGTARELSCTITPKSGGGSINDLVRGLTGRGLQMQGAPASIGTTLVNGIKLVSLSFKASSDPNSEKSISGTVNAFGVRVNGLIKFKKRASLFLISLTKGGPQPNLSLRVGSATLRWSDIAGLVQANDKIIVAFASDDTIGRGISNIGSQSLAEPMDVSKGFSFKIALTTAKPSGRDGRNAVAQFIGDKMRINQVTISFGIENGNKIALDVSLGGRVDIWKLRLSQFKFYIKKGGVGSIEMGMGVTVLAQMGQNGKRSDAEFSGTFGLIASPTGLGITASLTQRRDWHNAFSIDGLTLKGIHVSGAVDVLPSIKPKSLKFRGTARLSSGVSASASCVFQTSPSQIFYIGIAATNWKMIDVVNWRLPSLPGKQMFDGIKFGSATFEMAMAFGGSFRPVTVTKPDGGSRHLRGPMLYFDIRNFNFGSIRGDRMTFDLGFGNNAGITVNMHIKKLNFGPFQIARACNSLNHGPRFYLRSRLRESFRMDLQGAVRGCVGGVCACAGVSVSFQSSRIRACVNIKVSNGITYDCDYRCSKCHCRKHWGVTFCSTCCKFHRRCNDGAIKFNQCATINLPNRRRSLGAGEIDPIPKEVEDTQNWKMGAHEFERAPRKIRLARSCVGPKPLSEKTRVYSEISKADCAELCVADAPCTGIAFGKRQCWLVQDELTPDSSNPECDFNIYKVDSFDNDKHFVAVEEGVNVYGSHAELDEIKHLVRCISDEEIDGWKVNACGGVSEVDRWGTCEYKTWSEAEEFCRQEGARLPTRAEVESGCVNRVGFCSDTEHVWTLDDASDFPDYKTDVPEEGKSLAEDFVYTLPKGIARCELESLPISSLGECKSALSELGLAFSSTAVIDSPLSPCGCHYNEEVKQVTFNKYQDPCGCWTAEHSECPDLRSPPYENMDTQDAIAQRDQSQPVCKRNLQQDINSRPKGTANLRNFLETHFASGLAESEQTLILGGKRDQKLFGENPFPKPEGSVFTKAAAAIKRRANFVETEYGIDRATAMDALLYYEKEVEMGVLMKHLETLTGMCIEHQAYCFAMSLVQNELFASSSQFTALEEKIREGGFLNLDSSKMSVPKLLLEEGFGPQLMHRYQRAKADYAAHRAVEITKRLSVSAFASMEEAMQQDPRVVLTGLRTLDMNYMDMERTQTLALQGEGFFLGRTEKMDFDILMHTSKQNSGEAVLDELRRDLHTEFMVDVADGEGGVISCEELESTKRLLIADLIDEFSLEYERFAEKAAHTKGSVQSVNEILACVRHPTTRTTKSGGSKYLVWDVIGAEFVVAARSNGLWHEAEEIMESPLVSKEIYDQIMSAHSEERLSNNDACQGLNEKVLDGRCCEGLTEKKGRCVQDCTARMENPEHSGFFVSCCGGLTSVEILGKDSRKPEFKCVAKADTCFGYGEAYTRDKPCCEGLVPGTLGKAQRRCVTPPSGDEASESETKLAETQKWFNTRMNTKNADSRLIGGRNMGSRVISSESIGTIDATLP